MSGINTHAEQTRAGTAPGRWVRSAGRIRRLIFVLEVALEVRRERQMLLSLDDRTLKDIGLSRSQVWREACRSLWNIPPDRLGL
jgi:uncharacterized protein YjiS (DUF1127 family)